jgi:DHA1 family inner membrane transport protein
MADRALMPTIGGVLAWSALVLRLFYSTAGRVWLWGRNDRRRL